MAETPVRAYLRKAPIFMALVRGVECRLLREAQPFAPPVLDLGCGDGLFASLALSRPEVGVDPDLGALVEARHRRAHSLLAAADAERLPFPGAAFGTVVANSVLEHLEDIEGAVAECARVLRPGGRLLITVPSHRFAGMLMGTKLLRAYGCWFNRRSRHFHTDSAATWTSRLEARGFEVRRWLYYLGPRAMHAFDLAHYLSLGRLVSRKLTGRWMLFPNPLSEKLAAAWFERHVREAFPLDEGAYLFLDATRA
jgi:SAM-dependent methyltransferase